MKDVEKLGPIPTHRTVSRMLLLGEKIERGTYIRHRNIIGSEVTHSYEGIIRQQEDTTIIRLGLYPTPEKPRGFMTDAGTAGEYYVPES